MEKWVGHGQNCITYRCILEDIITLSYQKLRKMNTMLKKLLMTKLNQDEDKHKESQLITGFSVLQTIYI